MFSPFLLSTAWTRRPSHIASAAAAYTFMPKAIRTSLLPSDLNQATKHLFIIALSRVPPLKFEEPVIRYRWCPTYHTGG